MSKNQTLGSNSKSILAETIPIAVSARHCHLSKEDFYHLFGKNSKLISAAAIIINQQGKLKK